jgi:hypothetical protein
MTITNTYAAEAWNKVYSAFQQINFTAYDYDTVKESLIQYLQIYHAEHFNDFIESDELVAFLEIFAYAAELISYRVDQMSHENFITTAQRKASILRLARLISYSAARNIPARGLVKIQTVRTAQTVYDSLGNNLANTTITWNDPNNTNWKEQFFLVMNLSLTTPFGQPSKSFQIADVLMQLYTFNNDPTTLPTGVFPFSASTSGQQLQMELVPIDIDANGPKERAPDLNAQFNVVYATDGRGDGSDYTGFLMFVKQGTLYLTNYNIAQPTANRRIELSTININDTDVWLYRVDSTNTITENWVAVDTLADQNIAFYTSQTTRKLYEVETLENDSIALIFGDGNFSDAPVGNFQLWTRVSLNQDLNIPQSAITNQQITFNYLSQTQITYAFNCTFSLTSAIQNNSASETIEHVRQSAPSVNIAQNRMVNGQDYNTFPLKDQTILRLNAINRTFAGQPKYIDWNDASGAYQNIKLFGDDLTMSLTPGIDLVTTTDSSQTIVDTYIEPLLSSSAILNVLTHISAVADGTTNGIVSYPRTKFIQDNQSKYYDINGNFVNPYGVQLDSLDLQTPDGSLKEKTVIQGALDQHWYGDPISLVTINGSQAGVVADPVLDPTTDDNLYLSTLPRTIDGINLYPPGDKGSGLQTIQRQQYFGLRYNRLLKCFGAATMYLSNPADTSPNNVGNGPTPVPASAALPTSPAQAGAVETFTIEMTSDTVTFTVTSNLRGSLPNYSLSIGGRYSSQNGLGTNSPIDFVITGVTTTFSQGDAYVIDAVSTGVVWNSSLRLFGTNNYPNCNLNGWWELIPADVIAATVGGAGLFSGGPSDGPNLAQTLIFNQATKPNSWVFLVSRTDDSSGNVLNWSIYNRDMEIIVDSPTTNFWYNNGAQLTDPETLLPVYDVIRILRSNLDAAGYPLRANAIYDVAGLSYDQNGVVQTHQLEVLPAGILNYNSTSNTTAPANMLQFEAFTFGSYQFSLLDFTVASNPTYTTYSPLTYGTSNNYTWTPTPAHPGDDAGYLTVTGEGAGTYHFATGNFLSTDMTGTLAAVRVPYVPAPAVPTTTPTVYEANPTLGLDFMWQHFTPDSNLIDPSTSNIIDMYVITQGYYTSVQNYVNGLTTVVPSPDTPLSLRTSYGYLLNYATLSDTVVLHPGKFKFLFGSLADQTLQATFMVVPAATATFTNERIQQEVLNTINTYFDISNWDFGDTFYATELIGLIHQALPTQIATVVIVPTYSVNSFGSLFTIDSGIDEVLQSVATLDNIQVVSALTPSLIRQS